jgi:hypothetical protein
MNHCVPILDVLAVPDEERDIIVMPLLRRYSNPPFETFGEVVDCLRQLFEVLDPVLNASAADLSILGSLFHA